MKLPIAAIGAALALSAPMAPAFAAPTIIGNVCGVPIWHHNGGMNYMFRFSPKGFTSSTERLTAQVLYDVDLTATVRPGPAGETQIFGLGRLVAAENLGLREIVGRPGCVDVTNDTRTTDDGTGFVVIDHDVPSE